MLVHGVRSAMDQCLRGFQVNPCMMSPCRRWGLIQGLWALTVIFSFKISPFDSVYPGKQRISVKGVTKAPDLELFLKALFTLPATRPQE